MRSGAGAPMKTRSVAVGLAGASARIASAFQPFIDYAGVHLGPLRQPDATEPRVDALLRWHEGPPPRDRLAAFPALRDMERVDRDLYRTDAELAWFRIDDLRDLHLRFVWDGERLRVEGDYFHRLSKDPRRDWLKRQVFRRRLPLLQRRRFTTLLYYLLYYPCFWWLERRRDLHPIHAAGAQIEDGIIVLAGPSGVGKSTLTVGLAALPGGRLLSDTFLLQHRREVWAVPEPLLLDAWSQQWLGTNADLLRRVTHRYCLGRNGFHWPDERLSAGGPVRLLLFPHRSPRHYVRPLSPLRAQGRLRAGDLIVNDMRRYWAYAATLELLDPTPLVQAREENLAALVGSVPIFEVGLTPDFQYAQLTSLVCRLAKTRTGGLAHWRG